MEMMYFRLNIQRKYILIGRASITSPKVIILTKRVGPYASYISLSTVLAKITGSTNRYRPVTKNPAHSLIRMLEGRP